ncbi:MAG: SDR family oxidoreductase [Rhodospirillum sp.]|nr:SDR family oxidoreductase [Rhodospirillum sp.]MCF8489393.1 SDR family oxidoreductase [Rhodospirillum sp.]MCF8500887.1 SDR family oxidoreductase [Rhodospirillum sp.]
MHIDLTGLKAIVTGSTAGIGLESARGLAAAGAEVVITGRAQDKVDGALMALVAGSPDAKAVGFVGDLGTAEGCAALVATHPAADILVNNLGVYNPQDFFEVPDEEWVRFFDINILSGVRLSRAYLPGMERSGWGRVVFISSESAFNIPSDMIHYGFTKTALVSIARGLAKRMAGTGVTVNSVLPGPTLTEGLAGMLAEDAKAKGTDIETAAAAFVMAKRPSSIIQRAATVEEVANMVVYTCSRQASATSGAALRVDGGVIDSL